MNGRHQFMFDEHGRECVVDGSRLRLVHAKRFNGDPIVRPDAGDGWRTALDANGYEYECGSEDDDGEDDAGNRVIRSKRGGVWYTWATVPGTRRGDWIISAADKAKAHAATQMAGNLAPPDRWKLPSGAAVDLTHGRQKVFTTLKNWAKAFRVGESPSLWLHGEPGRGKSQCAAWLMADLAEAGVECDRVNLPALVRRLRDTYAVDASPEQRQAFALQVARLQTVPVLVLEDVSADRQAEDVRKLLYDVIDGRTERGLPWIVTDNSTPTGILKAGWDGRIASRFSASLLVEVKGDDYRERRAA